MIREDSALESCRTVGAVVLLYEVQRDGWILLHLGSC